MLGSRELVMGNESVLVLVLVLEDLLHQLVVLVHHVLELVRILSLGSVHLLLQVSADLLKRNQQNRKCRQKPSKSLLRSFTHLIPAQHVIGVLIDLLEDVGGRGSVSDVDQLHVEEQSGSSGNNVSSSTVSVGQTGRDGQLPLLADAHVSESLVPSLDHLAGAQLEGEGLVTVKAGRKERGDVYK